MSDGLADVTIGQTRALLGRDVSSWDRGYAASGNLGER